MSSRIEMQTVAPWALRPMISRAPVARPESARDAAESAARFERFVPRGAGSAYGDSNVSRDAVHLITERIDKFISFDSKSGVLQCQSGVRLKDILEVFIPRGWTLKVTPGTSISTVGGCIACDVHGKNHHVAGTFGAHVRSFDLIDASNNLVTCRPDLNSDLFYATLGGLGQTGLITNATIELERIESSRMRCRTIKTTNLEETFASLESQATFSATWVDSLAMGRSLGRGLTFLGEYAPEDRDRPLDCVPLSDFVARPALRLPFTPPSWATNAYEWRLFNEVYYQTKGRASAEHLVTSRSYFYPLDGVSNWNRIFGARGFIEYQIALPEKTALPVIREILERLSAKGYGSFLSVIKKFGPRNPAPLSFPIEGYTFAVDMQFAGEPQLKLLDELDTLVAKNAGRVYLVKDSRLRRDVLDEMYPERKAWARFVNQRDPSGRFKSALVDRLGLRDE